VRSACLPVVMGSDRPPAYTQPSQDYDGGARHKEAATYDCSKPPNMQQTSPPPCAPTPRAASLLSCRKWMQLAPWPKSSQYCGKMGLRASAAPPALQGVVRNDNWQSPNCCSIVSGTPHVGYGSVHRRRWLIHVHRPRQSLEAVRASRAPQRHQ